MRRLSFLIDERLVILVITLNAFAIFLLESGVAPGVWAWVDYACVLYFVFEMVVKLSRDGWQSFWSSGWNRFDFVIVVASSPVLLMPVLDIHELAVLSLFRTGRLLRAIRLLRFIPDRDNIAAGIGRSLRASVGIFLGVIVLNFITAMCANMFFGDIAPEYFGNPLKACYSMFQIFTLEGWPEISQVIAERASETTAIIARCFFVGSVFGGGVIGLSLANAVFVDQMILDNNDDLEARVDALTEEIRALRRDLKA